MNQPKAIIKRAWPYQQDQLNLPVVSVDAALPFYETTLGFRLISRTDSPVSCVIIARDDVQLGLSENGGDPTQDGCFFEVDSLDNAFAELRANGLTNELSAFTHQKHGTTDWTVFFVVAPDGLCYCYGERQP